MPAGGLYMKINGALSKILANVAISGSYNDLTDKPNIPAGSTVDTALSPTSENPVQNKVINAALAGKADAAATLAGYGITDAKIQNGTITLGSDSITPLTQHQDISGKANDSSVVHLTGAETISGVKTFNSQIKAANGLYNSADDSATILSGGTDTGSARLRLNGKNASSNAGRFTLYAADASDSSYLVGDPDGTLTWVNKSVEVVSASSYAAIAGYVRYKNGLQIVWGQEAGLSAAKAVTFAVPFAHTPCVVGSANKSASVYVTAPSTTGCTLNCSSYSNTAIRWIAIGDWA